MAQQTSLGHPMRQHFLFDEKWRNLNHGSFGTYPIQIRNQLRALQDECESAPDEFIKYTYVDLLDKAREEVAALIHAPVDECVFVTNATSGVNVVLRNIKWQDKDVVIYFDTIYGACERTLFSVQEMHPQLRLHKVENTMPRSPADICTAFSQAISRLIYDGYKPRLAVFDTILSLPGARLPFERLVKICKEYGVLSLIDAAHAVGQIPLNMTQLDPDFFVSNCHKWLYVPRGCAVFYVPQRNQHLIRTPLPTSWGFKPLDQEERAPVGLPPFTKSYFVSNFQFVATADNSPYYCVPAGIRFRNEICGGDEAIYKYIRDTAQKGGDVLASILGTWVMDDRDIDARSSDDWSDSLRDCAMANILLPIQITGFEIDGLPATALTLASNDVQPALNWILETLVKQHRTNVQIFQYDDKIWTRISGQIYLEISDFEWLGGVLKQLIEQVRNGAVQKSN